jgi:hypothetical protein
MILQTAEQAEGANWNRAQCVLRFPRPRPPISTGESDEPSADIPRRCRCAAARQCRLRHRGRRCRNSSCQVRRRARCQTLQPRRSHTDRCAFADGLADSCRDAKGKFIECPAPAKKATCRDAKGQFIKCPATAKKAQCRDAKGKFTECPAADKK